MRSLIQEAIVSTRQLGTNSIIVGIYMEIGERKQDDKMEISDDMDKIINRKQGIDGT